MKRKFPIIIVFIYIECFVLLSHIAFAAVMSFTDVHLDDWFYQDVQYVYDAGLMNGTSLKTFEPYGKITRGMIVTILHRMEGSPKEITSCPFQDVGLQRYYREAITWASSKKIVNGYSQTLFGPDDVITRQQLSAILYRFAAFRGYDISKRTDLSRFADHDQISTYALNSMAWANAEGLINGTSAGELLPGGNATRAQSAAILTRFCRNIADKVNQSLADSEDNVVKQSDPVDIENIENGIANHSDNTKTDDHSSGNTETNRPTNSDNENRQSSHSASEMESAASAEDTNIFRVAAQQTQSDRVVELTVMLDGNVRLCGFDMTLKYDHLLFSLSELDTVHDLDIVSHIDNENGQIMFNYAGAKNITKSKTILTATFHIIGDVGQTSTFSLAPAEVIQTDDHNNVVSAAYSLINQTITIL